MIEFLPSTSRSSPKTHWLQITFIESYHCLPQPGSGLAREALEVPPGPTGAVLISKVRHYLRTTGVEEEFHILIRELLSRDELPYNPYPRIAVSLRPLMEKSVHTCRFFFLLLFFVRVEITHEMEKNYMLCLNFNASHI